LISYQTIFLVFLFNFEKLKSLNDDNLKKYCLNLECFLNHDSYSDIDCLDLFSELKVLKVVLPRKFLEPALGVRCRAKEKEKWGGVV
jgi:hypothetical protein